MVLVASASSREFRFDVPTDPPDEPPAILEYKGFKRNSMVEAYECSCCRGRFFIDPMDDPKGLAVCPWCMQELEYVETDEEE